MPTFYIDIDEKRDELESLVAQNPRIILSAKFGDGKTYLLNEFQKQYGKDYYIVTLHPVNYVIEHNKDIFEYIKRDILYQLASDGKVIEDQEIESLQNAFTHPESLLGVGKFLFQMGLSSVPLGKALIDGLAAPLKAVGKAGKTVYDRYREERDYLNNYLESFSAKTGSISEQDGFTQVIRRTLEHIRLFHRPKGTLLIIEDLDRLDPGHIFRLLNILAAHVDNPYYGGGQGDGNQGKDNKFGFDHVMIVMDYRVTQHIFHHFYGAQANFDGYIKKFCSCLPFYYSICAEARKMFLEKLRTEIGITDEFFDTSILREEDRGAEPIRKFLDQLSIRDYQYLLAIDPNRFINIPLRFNYEGRQIPAVVPLMRLMVYVYHIMHAEMSLMEMVEKVLENFGDTQNELYLLMPFIYLRENQKTRKYYTIHAGDGTHEFSYTSYVCSYKPEIPTTTVTVTEGRLPGASSLSYDYLNQLKVMLVPEIVKRIIVD